MKTTTWFKLIIVFSLLAMGGDALLTYNKLTDSAVGCPAGGGCDVVKGSIYSEFMGIPVSLFGMGAFATVILLAIAGLWNKLPAKQAFTGIFAVSGLGVLIALYFVYIMLFVLEAICPWCFFSHFMILFVFISAYKGKEMNDSPRKSVSTTNRRKR